jgi:hypothetical protein
MPPAISASVVAHGVAWRTRLFGIADVVAVIAAGDYERLGMVLSNEPRRLLRDREIVRKLICAAACCTTAALQPTLELGQPVMSNSRARQER